MSFRTGARNFLGEFQKFATRGNVIDLAVGVIIGGAFSKVTASLVGDLIMPLVSLPLKGISFVDRFIALDGSAYATLADATAAGAAVFAYGKFISTLIDFIFMAFAVFMLVKFLGKLKRSKPVPVNPPTSKACPYCCNDIPIHATRCGFCTSEVK